MTAEMPPIPTSMRAIALSKYCKPSEYNLASVPVPKIAKPDEVLIKVSAASVNPVDVKLGSGVGKMMEKAGYVFSLLPSTSPQRSRKASC